LGDCVGWIDGDELYLDPAAAYRVFQKAASEAGESLPVSEQILRKRLHEKGLLASTDLTGKRLPSGVLLPAP
jgi:hypothetical protein